MTVLIELSGVVKDYSDGGGSHRVLDGVSLRIAPGEFVAVVGRSGSGKSTLLHLLGGLDVPTAGRVLFDGEDLGALPDDRRALLRRERIGFVFQDFNLIPTLTVEENLLLPLQLNGLPRAEATARSHGLLARLGLAGMARRFPESLSGGEQQRLAVIRAVAHAPDLVIADEPTGNLDLDTAQEVLDLLQEACSEAGRTLVMATHSPEVIGRAGRVLRLARGVLEEDQ